MNRKSCQLEGGTLLVLMSLWGWTTVMEQDEFHTAGLVWERMREVKEGSLEKRQKAEGISRGILSFNSRNRCRPLLVNLVPVPSNKICLSAHIWSLNAMYYVPLQGMVFHEDLAKLGEKENLKERKLSKAVESFTWNITVLKVSAHFFSYIHSFS